MPRVRIEREVAHPGHVQFGQKLTEVGLGEGLPDVAELQDELIGYINVLLGREEAPIDSPYLSLQEIATAYFARAQEMEFLIHAEEQALRVVRGSPLYKFRTGQLRAFQEMAKRQIDLGSRRLTQEKLLTEQRYDAGEM